MENIKSYRSIAIGLALAFGIFNVGLPIIIASCPMSMSGPFSVCVCAEDAFPIELQITYAKDTSCCTTVIAADRNTTQFLQGKTGLSDAAKVQSLVSNVNVLPVSILHTAASMALQSDSSPPIAVDIPIFTSSLLI